MDPTTAKKSVRLAVSRCKRRVMQNTPFDALLSQLDAISEHYKDRILTAEIHRMKLAIKEVTRVQREAHRREYMALLINFVNRLPNAIRAAHARGQKKPGVNPLRRANQSHRP